jgi:very-short-patch-repair endonuclease
MPMGVDRARSATEAFLYRRLESLPATNGRFNINAALPIAFDGFGRLEVDLLCDDARVAVELDGAQHLADPVAYRRDRRKDQLLQENGYLVLRFLAEDVGKELDLVLDAILRSLSRRNSLIPVTIIKTLPIPSAERDIVTAVACNAFAAPGTALFRQSAEHKEVIDGSSNTPHRD